MPNQSQTLGEFMAFTRAAQAAGRAQADGGHREPSDRVPSLPPAPPADGALRREGAK